MYKKIFLLLIIYLLSQTYTCFSQEKEIVLFNKLKNDKDSVVIENIILKHNQGRYNETYGVYESYIKICFNYENISNKPIKGISFTYRIFDIFSKEIYSGMIDDYILIASKSKSENINCNYHYKNELTIYELPYDKLFKVIKGNGGSFTLKIKKIVF